MMLFDSTNNQKVRPQQLSLEFQHRMIEALQSIEIDESLLFEDPYDCLKAFTEKILKRNKWAHETMKQIVVVRQNNKKLKQQVQNMKSQTQERIKKQEMIIQQLNLQIINKKERLKQLQTDLNSILKEKQIAEKQLEQTKQQMKILRLKLYEEQRQKLTQIIVANKRQMLEFRRTLQMDAYKQQIAFRSDIEKKDKQIKSLTKNIQQLACNTLTSSSDLTILQRIVKPLRDTSEMKESIKDLKKQISDTKQQIRQKSSKVIGLEGKLADSNKNRDNWKSYSQRLQIQKSRLIEGLTKKTLQLEKSQKDKNAMELYYNQRWSHQFQKVKDNLDIKYNGKIKILEVQFQKKTKQVQDSILEYIDKIRILKNQIKNLEEINQTLEQKNSNLQSQNKNLENKLSDKNKEFIQNCLMARQDMIVNKYLSQNMKSELNLISQNLLISLRKSEQKGQAQKKELEQKISNQRKQFIRKQVLLKSDHQKQIDQLLLKQHNLVDQLNSQYSYIKVQIQKIKQQQQSKYELKQKQLFQRQKQQLIKAQKSQEMKVHRLSQKISEMDLKFQKLRKRRQDQYKEHEGKKHELNLLLTQRQTQLITRDIQIQGYKEHKDTFMKEIMVKNKDIDKNQFQIQSLKTMIESKDLKIQQLQNQVNRLINQKHVFKQQLKQFQKLYKRQFQELKASTKGQIQFYKSKIWDLEHVMETRPIKNRDLKYMQELQKKNSELLIQVQVKQAQNLVMQQVKQYYEQKVKSINSKNIQKSDIQQDNRLFNSTTYMPIMREATTGKTLLVRKPTRKNKLISTSIKFSQFEQEHQNTKQEKNQMSQMKTYLQKKCRQTNQVNSSHKNNISIRLASNRAQRVKSSLM